MKYIQGVPTCLPTGRDEISWNFACKVDKKYLSHSLTFLAYLKSPKAIWARI